MPDHEAAELFLSHAGAYIAPEDMNNFMDARNKLARAYAAELDRTLVDEQWLRENGFSDGQNGYLYCFDFNMQAQVFDTITFLVVKNWGNLEFRNPTRGLIRTLIRITNEQKL